MKAATNRNQEQRGKRRNEVNYLRTNEEITGRAAGKVFKKQLIKARLDAAPQEEE